MLPDVLELFIFMQVFCFLVQAVNLLETFRRNMPIKSLRTYVREAHVRGTHVRGTHVWGSKKEKKTGREHASFRSFGQNWIQTYYMVKIAFFVWAFTRTTRFDICVLIRTSVYVCMYVRRI